MKIIRKCILMFVSIGMIATLLNADAANALDGAVQTQNFIKNIIQILVGISAAIAVVFVVIGGLKYITSSGHPEKLENAKKTLLYSGIGLVVVLAAYALVDVVANMAKSSFGS